MKYENGDIVRVKTKNANGREMPTVCIVDAEKEAYVSLLGFSICDAEDTNVEFLGKPESLQEYHLNDKSIPEYVENYREYMKKRSEAAKEPEEEEERDYDEG